MGLVGHFTTRCSASVTITLIAVETINFISNYNKVSIDSSIKHKLGHVLINDGIEPLSSGSCSLGFRWKLITETTGQF